MKKKQIETLVNCVLSEIENQKSGTFKKGKDKAALCAARLIHEEFEKEMAIEKEARQMLETLEGQDFERHKMFLMVKKKLAEKKGVIL